MITALPYISFAGILFLLYVCGNYRALERKVSVIASYFLFIVFFGLRGYIFFDVFNYKPFFDGIPDLFTLIEKGKVTSYWWEPGFVCYCAFFKIFTGEYLVFQFFDTLLDLILLHSALKWYNSNSGVNLMVLIAMGGLSLLIETLRNTKSILIIFISLRYIYNRQFFKFLLLFLAALSFHITSIIFLPLYFLLRKKYSRIFWVIILFLSILFFLFGRQIMFILFSYINKYATGRFSTLLTGYIIKNNEYSLQRRLSLGVLEKFLTFFAAFFLYKRIYKEKMILVVNCFLVYFILYFVFSGFTEVSFRLSMLFSFSYWVLWPYFLTRGFHTKYMKQFFLICLLLYSVLKCSLYSKPVQEYDNVLTGGGQRYSQRHSLLGKRAN